MVWCGWCWCRRENRPLWQTTDGRRARRSLVNDKKWIIYHIHIPYCSLPVSIFHIFHIITWHEWAGAGIDGQDMFHHGACTLRLSIRRLFSFQGKRFGARKKRGFQLDALPFTVSPNEAHDEEISEVGRRQTRTGTSPLRWYGKYHCGLRTLLVLWPEYQVHSPRTLPSKHSHTPTFSIGIHQRTEWRHSYPWLGGIRWILISSIVDGSGS